MAEIHIIDKIRLNKKGLCTLDENGKWVNLHKRQGDLDGACTIYSLVMAMLCQGLLTDEDIRVYNIPDRRTDKGKFLYHLFNEKGLIRNGYSYTVLAKEIKKSSFGITVIRETPTTNEKRIKRISEYINRNTPVIISTVFPNEDNQEGAHALLAVGVEVDSNDLTTKILCLDPGSPSPKCSAWNCFIDVSKERKSYYPFIFVSESICYKVRLNDMLIIDKR